MRLFSVLALAVTLAAQGLDPGALLKPPTDNWPTYNGDYSGRRYSTLAQINEQNVNSLTLAWAFQTHSSTFKGTPLEVNGILYFSVPDNVWAADARTGKQLWHYRRPSQGDHLASRGLAMYENRLYFGTPDAHLICLDARNGKEIWDITIADVAFGYYLSVAPLVVKNMVIVGTSGDSADVPHFLEALDAVTGAIVWRWNSTPAPESAAAKTWPNREALNHGGGPMWLTGTYDPELNLIYWGTGNPHPVLAGGARLGDNLYTCSIVALRADTGKLAWYFQPSPHDTHDWDAVETPVLFDANLKGERRHLLAQASRNGYFFVLDRTTGQDLVTSKFVETDWALGIDGKGEPIPNPAKEPQLDGSLVESSFGGSTNWMSPSFDPQTNLFYVNAMRGTSLWYLTLNADKKPEGHQGGSATNFWSDSLIVALDYTTGKTVWTRPAGEGRGAAGILTTAGQLLFTGDGLGDLLALDPSTGAVLWHASGGGLLSGSPMTYELDGRQYVLTGVDGVLYAWTLPSPAVSH
ncbi:MAG TPA: acido-empty-quinoprotein group A [Bryobacteraceae bacterium]|nr:acido-empty-quinoprotein group A [Bryobacteraceae bacterium]